jgi:effector-binding domain-containing protein
MNLTETPETVAWPPTHYVFVEKVGPFQTHAPQAWQSFHQLVAGVAEHNQITGYMSLYKVSLAAPPVKLSKDLSYMEFGGGKYSRFVLTGSYANLGPASGRVQEIISEKKLPLRDDYFIENYVNDPKKTPEEQLITEILVPAV